MGVNKYQRKDYQMKRSFLVILSFLIVSISVAQERPEGRGPGGQRPGGRRPGGGIIKDRSVYKPLKVNQAIPESLLLDMNGNEVKLNDLVAKQPSVLIFFRGGWCPFCSAHMAELVKIRPELEDLGYQIIAITTDKPALLQESISKHKMEYVLLSDPDLKVAAGFGIRIEINDRYKQHLSRDRGMTLSETTGVNDDYLPIPSVFVVDTSGLVKFVHSDENHRVRISNEALMAAVRATLK
jgi:peroxiredoxin